MADFQVVEAHHTSYSLPGYSNEYILEAGEKLSNDSSLLTIAGKTVPSGYRVTVNVDIQITNIEKLT